MYEYNTRITKNATNPINKTVWFIEFAGVVESELKIGHHLIEALIFVLNQFFLDRLEFKWSADSLFKPK